MKSSSRRCSIGTTLVEALVVIAIIGVLASLLLSAIAGARESYRRSVCNNRLRQMGIAIAGYESAVGCLPPGGGRSRLFPGSLHARLLPYLEQASLYDSLNFEVLDFLASQDHISHDKANATAVRRTVSAFLCPSESSSESNANYAANFGRGPFWARNWNGNPAPLLFASNIASGPWNELRVRRLAEFGNGLSQVIIISERIAGDAASPWLDRKRDVLSPMMSVPEIIDEPFGDYCQRLDAAAGDWALHFSHFGASWLAGGIGLTGYTHAMPPNSLWTMDCGSVGFGGTISARSFHPNGVSVLFADLGRIEFAADSIDATVWKRQSIIDDARVSSD